ncbi:hypothetical protein AVA65_07700 [Salmonella enterica subsp. enterica serovar Minnesota]|nr:hypothetical protein [Salmonella enterica subsp. enterica serovar Minnesota]
MTTRKPTSTNKINSAHYVSNKVHYARNGIYEIVLAEFPLSRCENTDASLERLARAMQREVFIVEYYSGLYFNANKARQCAKVLKAWYEPKTRTIKGMVQIEGPYGRHLDQLIRYTGEFSIALKGRYLPISSTKLNRNTVIYTEITGFRLLFPNTRSW